MPGELDQKKIELLRPGCRISVGCFDVPVKAGKTGYAEQERVGMYTNTEHEKIVTMLAAGRPVWYVAAVTKLNAHEVYAVGAGYGYPDRMKLRQAVSTLTGPSAA
jgi:hypothetical protein